MAKRLLLFGQSPAVLASPYECCAAVTLHINSAETVCPSLDLWHQAIAVVQKCSLYCTGIGIGRRCSAAWTACHVWSGS